jgi:hypothetical protein
MKIVISTLLLSYVATSSATGADFRDKWMLWDRLILRNHDATPTIFRNSNGFRDLKDCCRLDNQVRDCYLYENPSSAFS